MWELATWKTKKLKRSTVPYITLNKWQIKFNHAFIKLLEKDGLDWSNYVNCFVNPKTKQLGFLFHNESDMECKLKITHQNNTIAISAYSLLKQYSFINEVANELSITKRRFEPYKSSNLWAVTLE